jgi:hypothetical protein
MSGGSSARGRGGVRGVFIFALLAAFALLSLVVVVVGARSYRMINATAERAYISRTVLSYLVGKARGADEAGMVEVIDEGGMEVLTLGGVYGSERYNTYIYCDGERVREYFAKADLAFSPDYGEAIFASRGLGVSLRGGLLTISLTDADGETHTAAVFLQAAKEGGA